MTAVSGRRLRIYDGTAISGTAIVGARMDTASVSIEPIDITDKDDAGWRTYLANAGERSVSFEVEGVLKSSALPTESVGALPLDAHTVWIDGIGALNGSFLLANLAISGDKADAVTFTATLESGENVTGLGAIVEPSISGTPTQGQTLTLSMGTWAGSPSLERVWQRNTGAGFANIVGAIGLTYVLTASDVGARVRCLVTATGSFAVVQRPSNELGPVAPL